MLCIEILTFGATALGTLVAPRIHTCTGAGIKLLAFRSTACLRLVTGLFDAGAVRSIEHLAFCGAGRLGLVTCPAASNTGAVRGIERLAFGRAGRLGLVACPTASNTGAVRGIERLTFGRAGRLGLVTCPAATDAGAVRGIEHLIHCLADIGTQRTPRSLFLACTCAGIERSSQVRAGFFAQNTRRKICAFALFGIQILARRNTRIDGQAAR